MVTGGSQLRSLPGSTGASALVDTRRSGGVWPGVSVVVSALARAVNRGGGTTTSVTRCVSIRRPPEPPPWRCMDDLLALVADPKALLSADLEAMAYALGNDRSGMAVSRPRTPVPSR